MSVCSEHGGGTSVGSMSVRVVLERSERSDMSLRCEYSGIRVVAVVTRVCLCVLCEGVLDLRSVWSV